MKHIKKFEGFSGKYNTSLENDQIVVDITVKKKLGKILKDLNSRSEKLVKEFIEYAEFKDLKNENDLIQITLNRLLKKFDSKCEDEVLADINKYFKPLNDGNAKVDYKLVKK